MCIGFSTQLSRGPRIGTFDKAGALYRPQGFVRYPFQRALALPVPDMNRKTMDDAVQS